MIARTAWASLAVAAPASRPGACPPCRTMRRATRATAPSADPLASSSCSNDVDHRRAAAVGDERRGRRRRSAGRACGPGRFASGPASRSRSRSHRRRRRARPTPTRCLRSGPRARARTSRRRSRPPPPAAASRHASRLLASRVTDANSALDQAFDVVVHAIAECGTADCGDGTVRRARLGARATRHRRRRRSRRCRLSAFAGQPGPARPAGRRLDVDARARTDRQGHVAGARDAHRRRSVRARHRRRVRSRRCWHASTASRSGSTATTSLVEAGDDQHRRNEPERIELGWPAMGHELVPGETVAAGTGLTPDRGELHEGLLSRARSWSSGWTAVVRRHRARCAGSTSPRARAAGDPVLDGDQVGRRGHDASRARARSAWVKRSSGVGDTWSSSAPVS